MAIATDELADGITKVVLDGRLDIDGAAAIDPEMLVIAGSRKAVLVDLQKVSYIGSMALRSIVGPARMLKSRGGKMVLFGPNEFVGKVLKAGGIDMMVPVHTELAQALAALR